MFVLNSNFIRNGCAGGRKNFLSLLGLIFALYLSKNIIMLINVNFNAKRTEYQKIASEAYFDIQYMVDGKYIRVLGIKSEIINISRQILSNRN